MMLFLQIRCGPKDWRRSLQLVSSCVHRWPSTFWWTWRMLIVHMRSHSTLLREKLPRLEPDKCYSVWQSLENMLNHCNIIIIIIIIVVVCVVIISRDFNIAGSRQKLPLSGCVLPATLWGYSGDSLVKDGKTRQLFQLRSSNCAFSKKLKS